MKKLFAGGKYLAKVTLHTFRYVANRIRFSLGNAWKSNSSLNFSNLKSAESNPRITIVFHAYHLDIAKKIFRWISDFASQTSLQVHVIVTTTSDRIVQIESSAASDDYSSEVIEVENHGRDIWPFLQICQSGKVDQSALVLKIHTKGPRNIARGVQLSEKSVHELLHPSMVPALLVQAERDPYFVATFERYIGRTSSWGKNLQAYFLLLKKLDLKSTPSKLRFPAGTIFWTTGDFAKYLGSLRLERSDFGGEPSPDDGATEHVVERLFGMLAKDNGGVIPLEKLVNGGLNANRDTRN